MDRMEIGPDGKPCRACVSVEDMMKRGRELLEKHKGTGQSTSSTSNEAKSENKNPSPTTTEGESGHFVGKECPVDKDELGRSTWNLLHTMSVYYPEKPTEEQKTTMSNFMDGLAKTYPCDFCAKDLRKDLKHDPPKLASREEFSQWMCRLHNKVNEKTGKPSFDCSKIFERWKDGSKDGSCDY